MKGEKKFQKILDGIEGWLSQKESEVLFNLARISKASIVEIGAWKGKSTICLALGSLDGKKSHVYSIDTHKGSIEHQKEGEVINTYPEYIENITKNNMMDKITPLVMTSEEASKNFSNPIGLLFIDGSHEYEDVKLDFQLWIPKLIDGGYICIHDSNWVGVARCLREELTLDKFYNIQQVDSMIVAQKKSKEEQELMIHTIPPRRVIIATPVAADNAVSVWYVVSLIQSIKMSPQYNIELFPVSLANEEEVKSIQEARNELIAIAIESNVDDLVWIDSDIFWNPEDLFKLLNYKVDVVGGVYPKKVDYEDYPVQILTNTININLKTRLFEVDGLGTGFLRLTKKALKDLWDSNPEYTIRKGKMGRWVCDVPLQNGQIIGEDILLCQKLRKLGYKIYLDPEINCDHVGSKKYSGNFAKYITVLAQKEKDRNEKKATKSC